MKKILVLAMLLMSANVFAASSVVETVTNFSVNDDTYSKLELAWTDNATASFTDYTILSNTKGEILYGILDPGTPAPTDNYDVQIVDTNSVDIFGAELNDGSTTLSSQAMPKVGNHYGGRVNNSALTLDIDNQAVNSAQGKVILMIKR